MRPSWLLALAALQAWSADALILDRTHESRVFHETRHYRIFLPPHYETSTQRYPVIYWFHGHSERYNKSIPGKNYDTGSDYGGDNIANFVAHHDVIVVKWDGYNPHTPNEDNPRPYNIGPVETDRQFPLYFPEFVSYIDATYRTIPDREHRATAGLSMGGFMSFWIAGKYPDMVSSASNFMGSSEFVVGPREMQTEYRHDEMSANYAGVRTRLVTGSKDFIQFYHRQMNQVWKMPTHETEDFDFDHGTPGMAKTLAFHMNAFANPLPRPASWSHADVYPNFSVWDWTVESNRKRPGFTWLNNVSRSGFVSSVQEWLPDGKLLPDVLLRITTAGRYPAGSTISVTTDRAGVIKRQHLKTDDKGRLHIELDGTEQAVGIGQDPIHLEPKSLGGPPSASLPVATDFQVADHRTLSVFQHAIKKQTITLGEGNGDGKPNPGEEIVILFSVGDAFRAAELFTNDPCADLTTRISDNWGEYDWVGASAKYTVAKINCRAGHVLKLKTRIIIPNKPNHEVREATIELKVTP